MAEAQGDDPRASALSEILDCALLPRVVGSDEHEFGGGRQEEPVELVRECILGENLNTRVVLGQRLPYAPRFVTVRCHLAASAPFVKS